MVFFVECMWCTSALSFSDKMTCDCSQLIDFPSFSNTFPLNSLPLVLFVSWLASWLHKLKFFPKVRCSQQKHGPFKMFFLLQPVWHIHVEQASLYLHPLTVNLLDLSYLSKFSKWKVQMCVYIYIYKDGSYTGWGRWPAIKTPCFVLIEVFYLSDVDIWQGVF